MRLALDWGAARIGVAACDREQILAYPVSTVQAGPTAVRDLLAIVAEYEPALVYVGLPRSLHGRNSIAADNVTALAGQFAAMLEMPTHMVDERMTTVTAAKQLQQAGRSARKQRSVIDQAAAVAILNHALEIERNTGNAAGTLLLTD